MRFDWKHILNWSVVAVKAPETVMRDGNIIGYRVVVTYKYHGTNEEFYSIEEPRYNKMWTGPRCAAYSSYRNHLAKMQRQAKRRTR